ncbi:TetR/AcrR family transcriptional regulator [Frankia sp. Mgl5]|uniref:TetR/AcrR family transcriptional regulator n=1 Tax=Frankia sp. Mgl5 TaxID=2933793 RepID=UPI00200DFCB8|nr:TetR/AcrR family transcriptional regulator [Frankia sp. Mgl5]MCK9928074.1 TetR/AcrR family transcriptional regulator [Frankia sp. Mgl5]
MGEATVSGLNRAGPDAAGGRGAGARPELAEAVLAAPARGSTRKLVPPGREHAGGSPVDWRSYDPPDLHPILAGALAAFYEHGYHGTTVRDIARRAGVTVPALYYHYANKQGILVALLEITVTEVNERAGAAVAEVDDGPVPRFARLIEAVVLFMSNRFALAYLDTELRYLEPVNRRRYATLRKKLESLLVEILADGKATGQMTVDSPRDTARALLGMCQAIAGWYNPAGELSPTQIATRYVGIALQTVGVVPR